MAAAEEETQEVVTAESARTAGRIEAAEPDAHAAPLPPSRWGRLEGLMTPAAPSIAAAAGATQSHTQSESFANAEQRVEQLDQHTAEHGGKTFVQTRFRDVQEPDQTTTEMVLSFQTDAWRTTGETGRLIWSGTAQTPEGATANILEDLVDNRIMPGLAKAGVVPEAKGK